MKVTTAFPSEYLKAIDLEDQPTTVTMSHVTVKDLNGTPKPILHFQGGGKGMVLNETNANSIADLFGDDMDKWTGEKIVLYPTMIDFQGKSVASIRVRAVPAKAKKLTPAKRRAIVHPFDDEIPETV